MSNMNTILKIVNSTDKIDVYVSGIMTDETCSEIANTIKLSADAGIPQLVMHINSYGGSVAGAWDIISAIKNSNIKFKAINEGFAISAASILLASADESAAFDYSTSMIHDPVLGNKTLEQTEGSVRELLTAVKDGIMTILNKRLKMPLDILSSFLKKETSWNAQEQLQYGLVDSIIETSSKPTFDNSLDYATICNIIQIHNNKNIENIMTQEEIDALIAENETLKAKIAELEEKMKEPTNVDTEDPEKEIENEMTQEEIDTLVQENEILKAKIAELEEKMNGTEPSNMDTEDPEKKIEDEKMEEEIEKLKTENFILKHGLTNKSTMIENAVKLHGVEVLNTIISFINNDTKALETKVNELQNVITNTVNNANDALNPIITGTGVTNYELMAEEIFGMKADGTERIRLKTENPELHEKLFNIYYNL